MISRRGVLRGGSGLLALGVIGGAETWRYGRARRDELAFGATVATTGESEWRASRRNVSASDLGRLVPGRRTFDGPRAAAAVDAQDALLAGLPLDSLDPSGDWHDLIQGAALDLWVLSAGLPVAVAGWEGRWRYAWPRDTAHVAVALSALGQSEAAVRQMSALARLVGTAPVVQARYLPEGGVPDRRRAQDDGIGWALWSADETEGDWRGTSAEPAVGGLVRHCAALALARVGPAGLPLASPDYWETDAPRLTLGTTAALLLGLERAASLLTRIGAPGDAELGERCRAAATRVESRAVDVFGSAGWPREEGRTPRDAAIAFMLPPYRQVHEYDGGLRVALDLAATRMARANGGYAPGESWRNDGISWTPEVALLSGAWATGSTTRDEAARSLRWLSDHRTDGGSLPEKVVHDGTSAGPAPLAWTAALTVLTVSALSSSSG